MAKPLQGSFERPQPLQDGFQRPEPLHRSLERPEPLHRSFERPEPLQHGFERREPGEGGGEPRLLRGIPLDDEPGEPVGDFGNARPRRRRAGRLGPERGEPGRGLAEAPVQGLHPGPEPLDRGALVVLRRAGEIALDGGSRRSTAASFWA